MSTVRSALKERNIEPDRVRYAEFVTVMLGAFVNQMNSLSDLARRSGPIADADRTTLVEQFSSGN